MRRCLLVLGWVWLSCAEPIPPSPPRAATDEAPQAVPGLWFVELGQPPVSRGGHRLSLRGERLRFLDNARQLMPQLTVVRSHEDLWNGLTVRIPEALAAPLRFLPGVKAVFPVLSVPAPPQPTVAGLPAEPELFTSLGMIGADVAQSTLGFDGTGVKVGLIDSGIDYTNPDLGGCFGPGCRVALGWDFVGDAFNGSATGPSPIEDGDPKDCGGHGTHVAGIVGANGFVKGVAPGVTFGAYRVLGCSGSTTTDLMLAAMERASADGMRVVNISIGSTFTWPEYPSSAAASQLVAQGVVVVASQGNSGPAVYSGSAPGNGYDSLGVGSADNVDTTSPAFTASPDNAKFGYVVATGSPAVPSSGTWPLLRTGTTTTTNDACSALAPGSLSGSWALIRRGTCTFYTKAINAQNAGAVGVVFYNSTTGTLTPTVTGTPAVNIPAVMVTQADGVTLDGRIQAGATTVTFGPYVVLVPSATGGQVSSFTAYGPTPELGFKPDLTAPGGNIYSTWLMSAGGHASVSGTSMASPHVAGSAALLLQARPALTVPQVRQLLVGSAVPIVSTAQPGVPDATQHQGAGLLRVDAAIKTPLCASPPALALGESSAGPATVSLALTNLGSTDLSLTPSHLPAATVTGTRWAPVLGPAPATAVTLPSGPVAVPAGSTVNVSVTLGADPALADGALYGGWLVFTDPGGAVLRVPYSGFKGDYQSVQVLTGGGSGYPWLASKPSGTYVNQPGGATYTLQNGDVPYVVAHFEAYARTMKIEVFDAATAKPWGTYYTFDFVSMGSSATNTYEFPWDGYVDFDKQHFLVPNGSYKLKLSALKALGDASNPNDWESWTSPVVTLDHP